MLIAISGTPGTGKTSICEKLDYNIISLKDIVDSGEIEYEIEDNVKSVSIEDFSEPVKKRMKNDVNIVEGLLAHNLETDVKIILRCEPDILRERLEKKGWNKEKIDENVEYEMLGSAIIESEGNVYELDTSKKSIEEVLKEVEIILNTQPEEYRPRIDWMDNFKEGKLYGKEAC